MGWRDFQTAPPPEFMEFMDSMTVATALIPFVPLIPKESVFKNGEIHPNQKVTTPAELPVTNNELPASTQWITKNIIDDDIPSSDDAIAKVPTSDGRSLQHYCELGDCWCSVKLPGGGHPESCIRHNCRHLAKDHNNPLNPIYIEVNNERN